MLTITIILFIGFIIGFISLITAIIFRKRMPQGLILLLVLLGLLLIFQCGIMFLTFAYITKELMGVS